jgi:thiamine biosynthesis lipoprotein ApbE
MNKTLIVPALLACSGAASPTAAPDVFFNSAYDHVLGTSLGLKIGTGSRAAADRAQLAALREIDRLSRILSSWDSKSEFSQWTRSHGEAIRISPELFDVLGLFDRWRVRTDGAIDPAAQAVIAAWTSAAERQRVPTSGELATALGLVRQPHWRLNMADGTATRLSKTPLVLASFTKSYIMDRAVNAAMQVGGIDAVVLNLGGDIVVRGAVSEPIDIVDPKDNADNGTPLTQILVRDRAVATSGDYRRGVDIDDVHFSHIVDPRTGMPAGDVISSTVVAKNPADAGALATAFSILTPAESQQLAASMQGVDSLDYLIVEKNGRRTASAGWNQRETAALSRGLKTPGSDPGGRVFRPGNPAQAPWDATMELAIDFEIPQLGGGALRPFIAVWIEDENKFPVRTLALWYHEDRFLTEFKSWYRADRLRLMSETTSIVRTLGGATKPPGKYSFKWDGKDQAGNFVKAGTYTVSVESSREHGTYQIDRQVMTFTGKPQRLEFKPGSELGPVTFDYKKIAK